MDKVLYFAYGANRDARMISAITGKPAAELVGHPATLEGYSLGVQRLEQITDAPVPNVPKSAREILREAWDDDFETYVIKPDPEGRVAGTIWELTPDERERVRDWELVDLGLYHDAVGQAVTAEGQRIPIVTEAIEANAEVDRMVDGMDYETWLADPERFEAIASEVRREYDERIAAELQHDSQEPNPELG